MRPRQVRYQAALRSYPSPIVIADFASTRSHRFSYPGRGHKTVDNKELRRERLRSPNPVTPALAASMGSP
jgi:hypothetical protein